MAYWLGALIPVVAQVIAYGIVFAATTGNGSFVGLLALPTLIFSAPLLWAVSTADARRKVPAPRYRTMSWVIAVVPPILCLILNALVT